MKLSHTTKVKVRQALTALRAIDAVEKERNTLLDEGYGLRFVLRSLPKPATCIAKKAGFKNRAELEQFARRYHLL